MKLYQAKLHLTAKIDCNKNKKEKLVHVKMKEIEKMTHQYTTINMISFIQSKFMITIKTYTS